MRISLAIFFLLRCFFAINAPKQNYEIKYMNSLVASDMIDKFLLQKTPEISLLNALSTQSPHRSHIPCSTGTWPHLCPGPWKTHFMCASRFEQGRLRGRGKSWCWANWLMLASAQGWPQPEREGREEMLLLFLLILRKHMVEGNRIQNWTGKRLSYV